MKRFVSKVQNLTQKAAEIQQALKSVPPKIAELRQTVSMTAGQLHQLRADVQSSVSELRVENPEGLIQSLQEINDNTAAFEAAGYVLWNVEMELSPVHQLMVHLDKTEDVPHSQIRSEIAAHQNHKTVQALLSALLQAESVADRVSLSKLSYRTLIVHVGPVPSVRLSWTTEAVEAQAAKTQQSIVAPSPNTPTQTPAMSSPVTAPTFGQTSFFEPRPASTPLAATSASNMVEQPVSGITATEIPAAASVSEKPTTSFSADWKREAMERLKSNPHTSKYSR